MYANPRYLAIAGCKPETVLGTGWLETIHPDDRPRVEGLLAPDATDSYGEIRFCLPDGAVRHSCLYLAPVFDSQHQLVSYVGAAEDITERRQISQMKDEFISMVSHELRTPLSSIQGSLGLLAAGVLDDRAFLEAIALMKAPEEMVHHTEQIQPIEILWDTVPVVAYQSALPAPNSGNGRVILLHGLSGSASQWTATLSILSQAGYNSIALDLPGHGRSGLPTTHLLTPRWMGQALATWLEALPTMPTVLVGHSLGGWVVLQAGLKGLDSIAGLVLVASAGLEGIALQPPKLDFSGGLAGLTQQVLNSMFYQPKRVNPQVLQALLTEAMMSPGLTALRPEGVLQPQDLQQIRCPVQVIWGEQDQIIPATWAQAFVDNLPQAELALIPECGHFPHLETPEVFHECLSRFIATHLL